jgi:hypothetical protein
VFDRNSFLMEEYKIRKRQDHEKNRAEGKETEGAFLPVPMIPARNEDLVGKLEIKDRVVGQDVLS